MTDLEHFLSQKEMDVFECQGIVRHYNTAMYEYAVVAYGREVMVYRKKENGWNFTMILQPKLGKSNEHL